MGVFLGADGEALPVRSPWISVHIFLISEVVVIWIWKGEANLCLCARGQTFYELYLSIKSLLRPWLFFSNALLHILTALVCSWSIQLPVVMHYKTSESAHMAYNR